MGVTTAQRLCLAGSYGRLDGLAIDRPERALRRLGCGAGTNRRRHYDRALGQFASPPGVGPSRP